MAGQQHILYKLTPYLRTSVTHTIPIAHRRADLHGTDDSRLPSHRGLSWLGFHDKSSLPSQGKGRGGMHVPKQATKRSEQSYDYSSIGYRDRLIAIHRQGSPLLRCVLRGVSALKVRAGNYFTSLFNDILVICTSRPRPQQHP